MVYYFPNRLLFDFEILLNLFFWGMKIVQQRAQEVALSNRKSSNKCSCSCNQVAAVITAVTTTLIDQLLKGQHLLIKNSLAMVQAHLFQLKIANHHRIVSTQNLLQALQLLHNLITTSLHCKKQTK